MILETRDLSKVYKHNTALNKVNISLERGKIYGFVGRNGAGKTTLLRIITGLAFASSGELLLFGASDPKQLNKGRSRMSGIIESPALFMKLTAYENMQIAAMAKNSVDFTGIFKKLNLESFKNKPVKDFSLGMKQRLCIAAALIGNPEFLILDEPLNGLDPPSIVEIMEFLRELNAQSRTTILISSHVLSDLSRIATDFIIIDKGVVLEQTTSENIAKQTSKTILLETVDFQKTLQVLQNSGIANIEHDSAGKIKIHDEISSENVCRILYDNNILIKTLSEISKTLESYFMDLIR